MITPFPTAYVTRIYAIREALEARRAALAPAPAGPPKPLPYLGPFADGRGAKINFFA